MKEYVGKVLMDLKHYPGEDLYSDGDIEDELLEIVQNHSEDEYNHVIAERKSWPILYHLSHVRTNILGWYPFTGNERILEIGSGCGAITGILSDRAKSVTCVELSKKRSLINANRNRNRDNIEIQVGNFQDIERELEQKYDIITLIGVFEYAKGYINNRNPYEQFLKIIKKHLAPNGKIIIAIENRLGMKYFAGCTEDHIGGYFEGIEGYPSKSGVRTFAKPELERVIKQAGMNRYQFYYPYPDYKLPMSIYSDDYLPRVGELRNNTQNFDRRRMLLFNEARAFDSLVDSGLFPLYANSFLVIIEGKEEDE